VTGFAPRGVVLATRSAGKLAELRALFASRGIEVSDLNEAGVAEDPAEDALEVHETFEANARAKASWFAARLPGRTVVADDSGLEVDALGGGPGVRSKRWSGSARAGQGLDDDNNAALLAALRGKSDHRARYVSVVVARHEGREWVARGSCEGRIVDVARGNGGFGYDPFFLSDELGRTFGEVTREEKARVSHRARAFRALLDAWGDG
jgi:XTP/dITP diphosphohydrolase